MHCDFVFAHPYVIENAFTLLIMNVIFVQLHAHLFFTLCVGYPCLYILTHCSPLCTVGLKLIYMLLDVILI